MKRTVLLILLIFTINFVTASAQYSILNNEATNLPGSSNSDWSAIALTISQTEFDKNNYIEKLGNYVAEKYTTVEKLSRNKATEWHRIAILVNLLGYDATEFYGVNLISDGVYYKNNLGKQGLNGYIWALITISSGDFLPPEDAVNTKDSLVEHILSKQNSDGGFSLSGNNSSCDITAMAIYALSSCTEEDNVSTAVESAINFLSSVQNDDGTFSENGIPNAESTAQVVIALAALEKDPFKCENFPKLYDGLMKFQTEGGFSHVIGGDVNVIATYQSVCAIKAAEKKCAIYSNHIIESSDVEDAYVEEVELPLVLEKETEIIEKESEFIQIETTHSSEFFTEPTRTISAENKKENINPVIFVIPFAFILIYVIIRRKK